MKFFLDSAIVDEIQYALDAFDIDGVTTNPRHVQVSGKPFLTVIQEIAKLVEGTDKTISVEVNPHYMTYEEMVPEAEKLAAISPEVNRCFGKGFYPPPPNIIGIVCERFLTGQYCICRFKPDSFGLWRTLKISPQESGDYSRSEEGPPLRPGITK